MEELAEAAGIPVRTLRFYRERRLLPPPRRDGRIAWYSDDHLARLRTITALLDRGHTLGGIAELIGAWENGRTLDGVAELLGLEGALTSPWSDETPVRLTPQELADYFGEEVSAENLTAALDIGYIVVDGEDVVHISRRLLEASAALVREGIPLSAVLDAGRAVRDHVDAMAEVFTQVIKEHVLVPHQGPLSGEDHPAAETLDRLRPLAKNIVDAEMSLAMDRRMRAETDIWLRPRAATGAAADGAVGADREVGEASAPCRAPRGATCESGAVESDWGGTRATTE
ncbi:MerR family transcriptional regulator [Streptomyces sp. HPF1205]|uniref:MerR family transcriptional regulator n=1 Tax=Streptomyces sp. HPF1205 TaxID=2873262 RepID=UPI001CEC58C3|nr:MerR family transcriptional regulator [Streptomyces sp. HPF1205]